MKDIIGKQQMKVTAGWTRVKVITGKQQMEVKTSLNKGSELYN